MERFVSASFAPLVIAMAVMFMGCGDETSGETQDSGVVVKAELSDLPNCRKQATPVIYYVSSTEDFWYCDKVALEYIRLDNLDWPLDGIVEVAQATTGNCPAGGTTITAGLDADGDGIMDEVTQTETVCNGVDGIGWVVETETILTSGELPCPAGGIIINVGPDTNADGLIDGEPTSVETICHGIGWMVETETLPPSGESPCPTGGVAISAGPDANRDGQIDEEPPPFSDTVCSGSGCTVADNGYGTYTITCGDSTVLIDPACTVDDNGDGTATIRCNDGTHATVTDLQECGDGVVHYGEECDDGNLQERDGCSPLCVIEHSTCGDGVIEWDEECDDGNTADGDGCTAECIILLECGDGILTPELNEECDDGNTVDGDGCAADCTVEPFCGDGEVSPEIGEECDDGNTANDDGCAADCIYELVCGDNYVAPPNNEECDDGNNVNGDSCSAECLYEFLLSYTNYGTDHVELFTDLPNGSAPQMIAAHRSGFPIGDGGRYSTWSPDGSRIGYIVDGGDAGPDELYTSAPNGSDQLRVNGVLLAGGDVTAWSWSPDGARIAYLADQETDGVPELYTSTWSGSDNFKINDSLVAGGGVLDFSWSPDGTRIAYVREGEAPPPPPGDCSDVPLATISDGQGCDCPAGGLEVTDELGNYCDPDCDVGNEGGTYCGCDYCYPSAPPGGVKELFTNTPDGSENTKINDLIAAGGAVRDFAWSPDGDLIAYRADQDTYYEEELYTSSVDGLTKRKVSVPIVEGGYVTPGWSWSPNGDRIAYVAYQGSRFGSAGKELFTVAWDGSGNAKIDDLVRSYSDIVWSPDGTRIGYRSSDTAPAVAELFTSNPDGTNRTRVNTPLAAQRDVSSDWAWSPDGTRIAYRADQDAYYVYQLFTSRWDGTENHRISGLMPDWASVFDMAWSPDGTRIAYVREGEAPPPPPGDCSDVPLGTISDGQGCDCPAGGLEVTDELGNYCDPDCLDGNDGGGYCGCDYCYPSASGGEVIELFTNTPDGSENTKINGLIAAGVAVDDFLWDPAGGRIAYTVEESYDDQLYTSAPDGSDNQKVSAGNDVFEFAWSPVPNR